MSHTSEITVINIAFDAEIVVKQALRVVDPSYDQNRILQELETGKIVTTLWYDQDGLPGGQQVISRVLDDHIVAYVDSQEADGAYFCFREAE